MKIITEGIPNGEQILLDNITIVYNQEPDCTEDREGDGQNITISSRDGGGGKFIHIKTEGWSTSDEEDIVSLIKDFKKRAGIE